MPGGGQPGALVWEQRFAPGQYAEEPEFIGREWFFDPEGTYLEPETWGWYYCFYPTHLSQNGSVGAPRKYWLAAFAELPDGTSRAFGWKTTYQVQRDVSVRARWPGYGPTNNPGWTPNQYFAPDAFRLDLAFKITTGLSNVVTQQICPEGAGVKYVQPPNLDDGFAVCNGNGRPAGVTNWPWVLADDFVCTRTGPITDIHLWGSWLNDAPLHHSVTFWLGVYEDATNGFSHPGSLIWSNSFAQGQYYEAIIGTGLESFFEPGQMAVIGPVRLWRRLQACR